MPRPILIHGARQLLTLRGETTPRRGPAMRELGLVDDGAVLIVNGTVHEIGPTRRLENLAAARQAIKVSAAGRVVMPGFVDASTCLLGGAPRLAAYERRISGDVTEKANPRQAASRSARASSTLKLRLQAQQLLKQFLRQGTTTLESTAGWGVNERSDSNALHAIDAAHARPLDLVVTYGGATGLPPDFRGQPDDYVDWLCARVLPRLRRGRLAQFVSVDCSPDGFTEAQTKRFLGAAATLGFGLRVLARRTSRANAMRLAVTAGAACACHLNRLSAAGVKRLAGSTTVALLLPALDFHRGGHLPPARALIDQGGAVALATGFESGEFPCSSMPVAMAMACTLLHMSPAEAVTAATINGAHALGLGGRAGSLEPGKDADLLLLNAEDYREIPFRFGVNLVAAVFKRGEQIFPRLGAAV